MDTTQRTWGDFVDDLNDELIYPLLREYLIHYLRNFERFTIHYNPVNVKRWLGALRKTQDIQTVIVVCDEMQNDLYQSGEHWIQYDYVYEKTTKSLFGGMYAMNRDYLAELGFEQEELRETFLKHTPAYQQFQLQMCYELFWGWKGFGKQDLNTEEDYMGFADDLYTTISCSPFTKYYLKAINDMRETGVQRIFTTMINIIIHAYHYVIDQRNDQEKIIKRDDSACVWQNLWCDFIRAECLAINSDFTSNDIYDLVWVNEEAFIPKGLLD